MASGSQYRDKPSRPAQTLETADNPVVIPPRKPMRQVRRVSIFEREIHVRLSDAALEVLLDSASVLSEGQVEGDCYFGSTMLTIDLARLTGQLSEACDLATARDLEVLLSRHPRVRARARTLAAREARTRAGREFEAAQIDVRIHRNGRHFHIDVDVEATLEELS